MARPVRTLMPGSSERCPRGYICGQDVYQGMIQLLQVKSEKSKSVEGWPCSFSGSPVGHSGRGGCFTHALAPNGSNSNASVFLQQVLQSITSLHKLLSALQVGWPLIPVLHAMCPSCTHQAVTATCASPPSLRPLLLSYPRVANYPAASLCSAYWRSSRN